MYLNMFDLNNKTALITGSTQGIGLAVAECFHEYGAKVFIHGGSSIEKCEKAAANLGNKAVPVLADLSLADCADTFYEQTGDIDILVLNASVQYRNPWDKITSDEFDNQIKVNLKSSFELIQKYAPAMIANYWGRIITIGSVQEYKPHKDMAVYAASKAGLLNLTMNLAKQFAPHGVTVNNISPGVIDTPRNKTALENTEYAKKIFAGIPNGYAGSAHDCAGSVLLLASEAGKYITGSDIVIDGGMKL